MLLFVKNEAGQEYADWVLEHNALLRVTLERLKRRNMDSKQVGGDHYTRLSIQPWEAFKAWFGAVALIGYLKMCAIKYIVRDKVNAIEDMEKAIHCLERCRDEMKELANGNP